MSAEGVYTFLYNMIIMGASEFRVKGFDSITRTVGGPKRTSGIVNVPKAWKRARVMVILLEDPATLPPDPPAPKTE